MKGYLHLMKKAAFVFISILVYFSSNAQSKMIKEVFRLLPGNKVYHLTIATKDSMLEGKTYYPADNDSDEIVAYNYGISENAKDYLYVSMSFETEQRGTGMVEIRSFEMINGDNIIFVSQTGGVWQVAYNQIEFSTFKYNKDKKLMPFKNKILPATDESIFMKPGIPDSVKKKILTNSNMTFDLSSKKLTLNLNSLYISNDKTLRKWIKGDIVYFDWVKEHFVINKIGFQN